MAILSRFFGRGVTEAGGIAIGTPAATAIQPLVQGLANEAWERYPVRPISPGVAAALVAREIMTLDTGKAEAARSGIDGSRFESLVAEARQPPPIELAYELWRRGEISQTDFRDILARNGVLPRFRDAISALRNIVPSVTDLVRMAVREVFDPAARSALDLDAEFPGAFATRAAELGISEQLARDYWASHWQLPSYSQLAEMLFRGEITQAQFEASLKAQDYAPTWRAKLLAIARRIPTMTDFTRLAVRDVYSPAQRAALGLDAEYPAVFTAKAALHGMSEGDARDLWAGHWRLPSATQGFRMLWRNVITAADLGGLLKALDYAPVWRDRMEAIARPVLGRIDLRRALSLGLVDRATVKAGYQRLGFTAADAETLTLIAEQMKLGAAGTRDLTLSHWRDEYLGGFITETQLRSQLARLGYDAAEQDQLVQLYDAQKVKQARDRAVSRIGTQFIGYRLTRPEAEALLQRTGLRPEARSRIIEEWQIARDASAQQMTAAQVRSAYKKSVYTRARALDELAERGWRADDAEAFIAQAD